MYETDEVVRRSQDDGAAAENMKKTAAPEDITLDGEMIAQKGETIGPEHQVLVQEITTDRLTRVEQEHEEDHQSRVALSAKEIEELRSKPGRWPRKGETRHRGLKTFRLRQHANE
ncbi:MAG: hypothetical protein H6661_00485 [Ardenticatenaceae bacterium]|nr:hypothetical protein [Ardenticatenaceae bacterium]